MANSSSHEAFDMLANGCIAVFNASTNATLTYCNNVQYLPGPSILWALFSIAGNTMSQPSGRILGYPSSWNFVLRCSPVVCAASTLYTLIRLFVHLVRSGSLTSAMQEFADDRFGDEQVTDGKNTFDELRRNTAFRLWIFVFGALPSIVELYATAGIPYTQIWSTMFFASFLIDESLLYVAPPRIGLSIASSNAQELSTTWPNYLIRCTRACVVLGFHAVIHSYFLTAPPAVTVTACSSTIESWWRIYLPLPGFLFLPLLVACSWEALKRHRNAMKDLSYVSQLDRPNANLERLLKTLERSISGAISMAPWALFIATVPLVQFPLVLELYDSLRGKDASTVAQVYVIVLSVVEFLLHARPMAVLDILSENELLSKNKTHELVLGAYYMYLHMSLAFFFYGRLYSPSSSLHPAWVEWLGQYQFSKFGGPAINGDLMVRHLKCILATILVKYL